MTALPYDWKDIRARLQGRVPELLGRLGICEPVRGGMVKPRNPTRDDRRPGSFIIWTAGDGAGGFLDYATGDKGDVIDLIVYLGGVASRLDAYWWALEFLGLERGTVRTADQAHLDRQRAERNRLAALAKGAEKDAGRSKSLFRYWLGLPAIAGTLAETYLVRARGIDLARLPHMPRALRFAGACDHTDETTGEVTAWPAMIAAMTAGSKFAGVHRTWLARDGLGKAPVDTPKKMAGPVRGSAIRLASGPGDLSPTAALAAGKLGPLAIGEGIETSLTVAAARPDYRVWAAGSLSFMGLLDWPPCATAIVLLRDNDWKAEALAAFAKVEAHWRAQAAGRPLAVAASAVGSDFNDWARSAA